MENPALLLRRATCNRRQKKLSAPAAAPIAPQIRPPSIPAHTSSHASYTALMRSHDRVATRHIAPKGGA